MKEKYLTHLLQSENEQLQKLNHIVLRPPEQDKLLSETAGYAKKII